jgi:hypothetical protein
VEPSGLILASGTDVKMAATRLGHANPALLFDTSAHFIIAADQEAAKEAGPGSRLRMARSGPGVSFS